MNPNISDIKTNINDSKFYLEELRSDECQCGSKKLRDNTFCRKCYYELPKNMREDLYLFIGMGYEQARDAAVHYLNS